jgi:hypothetical protein
MRRVHGVIVVIGLLIPAAAGAQTVSEVIPSLVTERVTLNGREVNPALANSRGPLTQNDHTDHFFKGDFDKLVRVAMLTNAALVSQLTTYPTGYSSGGFTYTFDPATGTDRRTSPSFGPSFADRPLTIGKGHWSFGFNFQHNTFDSIEGKALESGDIKFYFQHNDCCPVPGDGNLTNPAFEQDLLEASMTMKASATMSVLSGTYGVTNSFDVGIILPIVSVDLSARLDTRLLRLGSENAAPVAGVIIHTFPDGSQVNPDPPTAGASATGLGDIVLRGKYRFLTTDEGEGGVAAGLDLRLPTGDEEELLGTGALQARFSLIASTALGRIYPHVNLAYTASGKGYVNEQAEAMAAAEGIPLSVLGDIRQPNEFAYTIGVDAAVTPRLTASFDLLGRSMLNDSGLGDAEQQYPCANGVCPPLNNVVQEFQPRAGNVNILLGAAGFKFNVAGNFLLSANVMFKLRDEGLVDDVTPVISFEYAF